MASQPATRVKRGRPSSSSLPRKILEGLNSTSKIKCPICNREFPRNKSLVAHMRVHTGERPYKCDYPNCTHVFRQSGHLRSHAYRHTGEKLFACPIDGCKERYLHSNRECTVHKPIKLVRDGKEQIRTDFENLKEDEVQWIQRYKDQKYTKGSSSKENYPKRKQSVLPNKSIKETSNQGTTVSNKISPDEITIDTSGYGSLSERSSPAYSDITEAETQNENPLDPKYSMIPFDDVRSAAEILISMSQMKKT